MSEFRARGRGRGRGRGNHSPSERGWGRPGGKARGRGSYQPAQMFNGNDGNDNQEMSLNISEHQNGHQDWPNRLAGKVLREAEMGGLHIKLNHKIREYVQGQDAINKSEKAEDWMSAPEIPTSDEISLADGTSVILPANRVDKPYKSAVKYLKTQYKLLREDATSPLRDAVDKFRKNPEMMDDQELHIYKKVYICGFTFTQNGIAARIKLSTIRAGRKIPWQVSKRLTSGTLVALSPAGDNFNQKCIVAIVAARPLSLLEKSPPEIDIYFSRPEDAENDPQQEFTMIEARQGYYEAYRHTLRALQKMSGENFPLSSLVTARSFEPESPPYLSAWPYRNLSITCKEGSVGDMGSVNVVEEWPASSENTTLDATQWDALQQILTKNLAIIQGPPGTGKTHVSKVALQVMIENRSDTDPPIIVAAQTNHALDQLLTHISAFDNNYVRLGGRSTDAEVKKHALYEIRTKERIPIIPGSRFGEFRRALQRKTEQFGQILSLYSETPHPISAETFFLLGIITEAQKKSLEDAVKNWVTVNSSEIDAMEHWLNHTLIPFEVVYEGDSFGFEEIDDDLEFEQIRETDAEYGVTDEEDIEQLQGSYRSIFDKWTVAQPSDAELEKAKNLLDSKQDLWSVPEYLRGPMYLVMQQKAKEFARTRFREAAQEYDAIVKEVKIGKWEKDSVYLKRANIIGLTTTGLSKYRPLIASLEPKIILIEEAAEVIEGPIAAACIESLEHLILVGDHQQLQGHCSVPELERAPYNLNVSMFERLVKMNMPFKTLLRQRRMRPEFRQLLSSLYPALEDHAHVLERAEPPEAWGTGDVHSFFLKHDWSEYKDESRSTYNEQEARIVAKFYRHLIRNGVPPAAITVLTFYNGQRKRILREIMQDPETAASYNKVKTVDSYQGEENEIILLSLVRSNQEGKIGFLSIDNRVCVALSRAKFGFYIFGNAELLSSQSRLWRNIGKIMKRSVPPRIGHKIPITCKAHKRTLLMQYPEDFDSTNGGCDQMCGGVLDCSHLCPERCHPYEHSTIRCQQLCDRQLACGHHCRKNCHESCFCDCTDYEQIVSRVALAQRPGQASSGYHTNPWNESRRLVTRQQSPPKTMDTVSPRHPRTPTSSQKLARGGSAFQPQMTTPLQSAATEEPSGYDLRSLDDRSRTTKSWSHFAGGGVKHDDERLELIRTTSSKYQDQGIQVDLLGLSPPNEMSQPVGAGRSRYVQAYQAMPSPEKPRDTVSATRSTSASRGDSDTAALHEAAGKLNLMD